MQEKMNDQALGTEQAKQAPESGAALGQDTVPSQEKAPEGLMQKEPLKREKSSKKERTPKKAKGAKKERTPKKAREPKREKTQKPEAAVQAGRDLAGERASSRSPRKGKSSVKPGRSGKSGFMLFSIRNKIIVSFLVPVAFMVVIGVSAYQKAVEGMSGNFLDASLQTVQTATEYVEMSGTFIASEAMKYAFNDELGRYYLGMYDNDPVSKVNLLDRIRSEMLSSQAGNPFVANIHIVTASGVNLFTTKTGNSIDGILEGHLEEVSGGQKNLPRWIDTHKALDDLLGLHSKADDYILSYQILSQGSRACIIIDLKRSAIQDFIQQLDFGEGSIVGFVTSGGKEIICEALGEGEESRLEEGETVFYGQDFFQEIDRGENLLGSREVNYKGEAYQFLYSASAESGAVVCALVPEETVTGQAEDIRSLTVTLVIIATVAVLLVGMMTVIGIQRNMRQISRQFGEVAKGDLTIQVKARGRDEFRGLADSATNMIYNTKKLVDKVNNATGQLEISSKEVEQASGIINDYSRDITQAIADINEGMNRQSEHAQECVTKTDVLSNEIQNVSVVVERVELLVEETETMIRQGMEIVRLLGDRAQETTEMTARVGESIESLRKESEGINSFVGMITDISEQTNLLSLNASIEAARAGDAGRGFAVVAEEIRKLADDAAQAAGEIRNKVSNIASQTQNSVENANQAGTMVALQTQAVEQVVKVFQQMRQRMGNLVDGLKEIVSGTERADMERDAAVAAVKNISDIIEETAGSAETVRDVAGRLLENVEKLNQTADALGENMDGLKGEISVFKI